MASTDARPVPIKNTAFRAVFPILDADGDLVTGATALDSEVSLDQGAFADATNEATEIATSSGMYYLDLTASEMNADCVAVIVKTSTAGAKTTVLVFYPEETGDINVDVTAYGGTAGTFAGGRPEVNTSHIAGSAVSTAAAQIGVNVINAAGTAWNSGAIGAATIADGAIDRATLAADTGLQTIRSNTAQAGAAGTLTLDASASAVTDFYVGAWILLTGGTGVGQARVCTAYNGTTKVATIAPNWATTPDATSTFAVLAAAQITGVQGNVTGSVASVTGAVGSVTGSVGSVTGAVGSVTGNVGGNVVGSVGSVASGGIAAVSFAAGAIDAAAIAAAAIGASELADNAVTDAKFDSTGKLYAHIQGVLKLVVGTGSTTTATVFSTVNGGAPSATNDFYKDRVIVFTSGTLSGQATSISSYTGATTTATVVAVTSAPANGDTAVIV